MLFHHGLALAVLALALGLWVAVQNAWRRAFPDTGPDPDVLVRRRTADGGLGGCHGGCAGCGGDGCEGPARHRSAARPATTFDRQEPTP